MKLPELWIVAGPNGAGKTTCVKAKPIGDILPSGITFFNPDERTRLKLIAEGYAGFRDAPVDAQTRLFFQSADEVYEDLKIALVGKQQVGVETVLSSDKYRSLVELNALNFGHLNLIYVALSTPAIAIERVTRRVASGGHGIPDDKIESRWKRSLANLQWFVQRAENFWILDNSNSDARQPPAMIAFGHAGRMEYLDEHAFLEMRIALQGC